MRKADKRRIAEAKRADFEQQERQRGMKAQEFDRARRNAANDRLKRQVQAENQRLNEIVAAGVLNPGKKPDIETDQREPYTVPVVDPVTRKVLGSAEITHIEGRVEAKTTFNNPEHLKQLLGNNSISPFSISAKNRL